MREDLGYPSWAIASMDAVQLQFGYICTQGTLLQHNPDKLSIYEQRRHFDESLHLVKANCLFNPVAA